MKKFLNKLHPHQPAISSPPPATTSQNAPSSSTSTISPPTALNILQHRHHHGTNLGSLFVLEKWLTPSMFPPSSSGDAELDALSASLSLPGGSETTKRRWAAHWNAYSPSPADLDWLLHKAKCTSIRLPIGYFTLGRAFCKDTPFEAVAASGVYDGAWEAVKQLVKHVRSAAGVGVLIDLHALPGGANTDAHSGTSSGKAAFWGTGREGKAYRELGRRCVEFVVRELVDDGEFREGVVGVQLCNEATWDAGQNGVMYEWYEEVLALVQEVDSSLPVYVSDGWDLERALGWVRDVSSFGDGGRGKGEKKFKNPLVVDTHKYYTFSAEDRSSTPSEILSRIPSALSSLSSIGSITDHHGGVTQIIIGEYSCVLDTATWSRVPASEKDAYVKQFGHVQSRTWQNTPGCAGSYFWTWKMDWLPGGEWGFVEQVDRGCVVPPPWLLLSAEEVRERARKAMDAREGLARGAKMSHEEYWNRTAPGGQFEHWRYGQGWDVGFSDALSFFVARVEGQLGDGCRDAGGGDKIGCLENWTRWRLMEEGGQVGSPFGWEWEHGFRAGVKGFEGLVGI